MWLSPPTLEIAISADEAEITKLYAIAFERAHPVKAVLARPYSMLALFECIQQELDGETTLAARFLRNARRIDLSDHYGAAAKLA